MPHADILLATLNARFSHCAFGLRCLQANLGELKPLSAIAEFTISQRPLDIALAIVAAKPRIVGLGVYIWNTTETLAVVLLLKALAPDLIIVLGGPEISHEWHDQPLFAQADHVITGEGEDAFAALCQRLLSGKSAPKLMHGGLPDTATMALPYELYTDADLAHRVVYVEASRGCPFRCEFCLSALDKKVRAFPLDAFLAAMDKLIERGLRRFKFVDRTFNLSPRTSAAILAFFLAHNERLASGDGGDGGNGGNGGNDGKGRDDSLFLHFEMVPDRFPTALRELIGRFAPGSVQFEVGVQTFAGDVAARIDRHQDNAKIEENLRFLVEQTGVHVHADLIIGLPGEDIASFGRGFDRLVATGVHEVQVGILKRLRGAPIAKHTAPFAMVYSPLPPYEILQSADWTLDELAQLRFFARMWDAVANSGKFTQTVPLILLPGSPFARFFGLSEWLRERIGSAQLPALQRWVQLLFDYLVGELGGDPSVVAAALYADYRRVTGKLHVPEVLRGLVQPARPQKIAVRGELPLRQRRHVRES